MTDNDQLIGGKTVVRGPLGSGGFYFLKGVSGVAEGSVYPIDGSLTIGRSPKCDIVINDEGISRRHARIECTGKQTCVLRDLDSSNGTFVNDRRIDSVHLEPGDTVAFHTVRFEFKTLTGKQARWESALLQGTENRQRNSGSNWIIIASIVGVLLLAGAFGVYCWVNGCF